MIRMVIGVRYVPSVWRDLVLLNELDSDKYELWIHDGFMEVLHGDMTIIQDTRCKWFL
jgi:hypothetical protein